MLFVGRYVKVSVDAGEDHAHKGLMQPIFPLICRRKAESITNVLGEVHGGLVRIEASLKVALIQLGVQEHLLLQSLSNGFLLLTFIPMLGLLRHMGVRIKGADGHLLGQGGADRWHSEQRCSVDLAMTQSPDTGGGPLGTEPSATNSKPKQTLLITKHR